MSDRLREHALVLREDVRHRETELRTHLIEAFQTYTLSRCELGRSLFEYRRCYLGLKIWDEVLEDMARIVRLSSRTLRRHIKSYEKSVGIFKVRKSKVRAGCSDLNHDEGSPGTPFTRQQDDFLVSRRYLRKAVAKYKGRERLNVLAKLIAVEAYEVWGEVSTINLQIDPMPSAGVVPDGFDDAVQRAAPGFPNPHRWLSADVPRPESTRGGQSAD